MHNNVRLIDANALLEELRSYGYDETSNAVFLAETATTVETTDDVLAKFGENEITFQIMDDGNVWCWDKAKRLRRSGCGKTPLEAVKKLASSINRK